MIGRIQKARSKQPRRRGSTLAEVGVAMVVLMAAMVAVTQLMATVAARRVAAQRELLARQETANLMERVFALPWAELNQERVAELPLSAACRQAMRDPQLDISVEPVPGTPMGRRIRIQLSWLDASGPYRRRTGLTAWRFAAEEREP